MKIYFFIVFFTLNMCQSQDKPVKQNMDKPVKQDIVNSNLKALIKENDSILVIKAVYFVSKSFPGIEMTFLDEKYKDWISLDKHIKEKIDETKIIEEVSQKIESFEDKEKFLQKISNWCNLSKILDYPLFLNRSIYFEQIIYEIPDTNDLFKKYLKIVEQDWSSLSSQQSYEIYYDTVTFLAFLSFDKQMDFISKYYSKIIELSKS